MRVSLIDRFLVLGIAGCLLFAGREIARADNCVLNVCKDVKTYWEGGDCYQFDVSDCLPCRPGGRCDVINEGTDCNTISDPLERRTVDCEVSCPRNAPTAESTYKKGKDGLYEGFGTVHQCQKAKAPGGETP